MMGCNFAASKGFGHGPWTSAGDKNANLKEQEYTTMKKTDLMFLLRFVGEHREAIILLLKMLLDCQRNTPLDTDRENG